MIDPRGLKKGDRVIIYGWMDRGNSDNNEKGLLPQRQATVVSVLPRFIVLKFDAGYNECWTLRNLAFALNNREIPHGYYEKKRYVKKQCS